MVELSFDTQQYINKIYSIYIHLWGKLVVMYVSSAQIAYILSRYFGRSINIKKCQYISSTCIGALEYFFAAVCALNNRPMNQKQSYSVNIHTAHTWFCCVFNVWVLKVFNALFLFKWRNYDYSDYLSIQEWMIDDRSVWCCIFCFLHSSSYAKLIN